MDSPFYQDLCSNHFNNTEAMEQEAKQEKKKKTKTKCRGNRKLQRYRRRLRKQCVQLSINEELSTASAITKPKESTSIGLIVDETTVSMKKCTTVTATNDSVDYTTVSDEVLQQKTSQAFNRSEKFNNIFNQVERIHFIRQYISLIDQLSFHQLQEIQWKDYQHIGTTRNMWHGRMSKVTADKYSISYTYGRSKSLVEQRLKQIQKHLAAAKNNIVQFEQDILLKCGNSNDCICTMQGLSSILNQLAQEKQQLLRHEFEYKRDILILDANDHHLLQAFLITEPNKTHIILARRIWEAIKEQLIAEEGIALLQYRSLSTSLQTKPISNLVHEMINNIDTNINNLNETVAMSSSKDSLTHSPRWGPPVDPTLHFIF
ncbi:unnamed protein product [Adineta ricciae]|uniref:Uncharacterized protein n=1 Tax=Adineta ricciae TaxID=249248 RepID=A0A816C813_ADIRI|nr:unnamed protein product [Adineta ricciae]CAF1619626.1 unnamed protein product [Adineta ricciae]